MRNDDKTENQHYVPKMLLRNFCFNEKEQVYVYDKWEKRVFATNIKNVASENNFNVTRNEQGSMDAEPFFTFIEGDAKTVINKILDTGSLMSLDYKDALVLQFFVASQYIRTRHTRESIGRMNKGFAEHIRKMGYDPAKVEGFEELDEAALKEVSLAMIQSIPDYADHLANKDWLLLKTDEQNPFFISDNPISFHNDNNFGAYGNLGFALKGIQIYCPLTPEFSLGIFCPSIFTARATEKMQFENELEHNKALALLSASAEQRDKSAKLVAKLKAELEKNPQKQKLFKTLDIISSGNPLELPPDNITFANYLQVRFSHRYIFSKTNDFGLVEKILSDHPDWKTGLMPTM